MKSHELAKLLLSKPDMDVVMASDPEGNAFETLFEVGFNYLFQQGRCENSIYSKSWTAEDAGMDEDEWEDFKKSANEVLVLWP